MYQQLPVLVVHPKLESVCAATISNRSYASLPFDVVSLDRLSRSRDLDVRVDLIETAKRSARLSDVRLKPHYKQRVHNDRGSGVPSATSYAFARTMPMYRFREFSGTPRYVIWPNDEPMPVCATYVDRVRSVREMSRAIQRAIDWTRTFYNDDDDTITYERVAVFDLDRTLIDDDNRPLIGAVEAILRARTLYDKLVLWSHGSALHVDEHTRALYERANEYAEESSNDATPPFSRAPIFDLVLSNARGKDFGRSCKNLLSLYNHFPTSRFRESVLIDDSPYNWTPEYTRMIVPYCRASVEPLYDLL